MGKEKIGYWAIYNPDYVVAFKGIKRQYNIMNKKFEISKFYKNKGDFYEDNEEEINQTQYGICWPDVEDYLEDEEGGYNYEELDEDESSSSATVTSSSIYYLTEYFKKKNKTEFNKKKKGKKQ